MTPMPSTNRAMRSVTPLALIIGLGLAATTLVGVGCGGSAASSRAPATAANPPDDEAAGLMEHHRYHHHGGVTLFIAMSLDTLGVSPEQREAVDKIRGELHAQMEATRGAEQGLVGVLADGLTASSFDPTKVNGALAGIMTAAAAEHEASADALDRLHAILTPPQRAALIDKVEAHWGVWRRTNVEEADANGAGEADGHLAMLTAELGLTPDQVAAIHARLAGDTKATPPFDRQAVEAHLRAFGDAFRGDAFDAKALAMGPAARAGQAGIIGWGANHLVHVVETMSPVLTPDQRAAFAQKLRDHAAHNPYAEGNS